MNDVMTMQAAGRNYYRLYFQEVGKVEKELEKDVRKSVLGFLYLISGDVLENGDLKEPFDGHFPAGETMEQQLIVPKTLPPWLTEAVRWKTRMKSVSFILRFSIALPFFRLVFVRFPWLLGRRLLRERIRAVRVLWRRILVQEHQPAPKYLGSVQKHNY